MTIFVIYASGATWYPNLQLMQMSGLMVTKLATNASGFTW